MRERIAKLFAVALASLIVVLAAAFAARQNAPGTAPTPASRQDAPATPPVAEPPDTSSVARGRAAFSGQGCARCHRMDGVGNPRSPLDGVGARLAPDRIRAFILAEPSVRDMLPESVARAKAGYARLPEAELDALVSYLVASRE